MNGFAAIDGDKLYHISISIEGYVLALPSVSIVAPPKSALILNATVWDNAARKKLNDKPEQVTVIEVISGETMLGSRLTQHKEKQMTNLTCNAAVKLIQNWLIRKNYQHRWFEEKAAGKAYARSTVIPDAEPIDLTQNLSKASPAKAAHNRRRGKG